MFGYITFFVIVFFSMVGIVSLLQFAFDSFFCEILPQSKYTLILKQENSEEAEYLVRSALCKTQEIIYVVDRGMTPQAKSILQKLKQDNERIVIG